MDTAGGAEAPQAPPLNPPLNTAINVAISNEKLWLSLRLISTYSLDRLASGDSYKHPTCLIVTVYLDKFV